MSAETWSDDERETYEAEILDEIRREIEDEDPVISQYMLKVFVSKSNGRGRKPRRWPRDVLLVVRKGDRRAVSLNDEGVARKYLDVAAQILLGEITAVGDDPFPEFMARLRAANGRGRKR